MAASEVTYEAHRRALLRRRFMAVGAVVVGVTALYEVVVIALDFHQWTSQWATNVVLLAVPIVAALLARGPLQQSPEAVVLGSDAVYTAAVVSLLLFPSALTSGVEAFTVMKLMSTAILIPWSTRLQTLSSGFTLALYWTVFWWSGRWDPASGELPHQLTSPFFAALLSIVGTVGAEGLRRQLFLEHGAAEREARVSAHFAATMSHELRNLLSAVLGYGEILEEVTENSPDPVQAQAPARLRALARHGLDVINVTLELSHLDSNRLSLDIAPVSLHLLFAELAEEFPTSIADTGVRLEWSTADALPQLSTDIVKLKMVLRNLVGNAIKFTEHGTVSVSARRRDGHVEIAVADTGAGIPLAERTRIFEPFAQGASPSQRRGGAGLGLYIARRLVEALGGSITLESDVGRGSTFRLSLPLDAPPPRRPPRHNQTEVPHYRETTE